ncbi:Alg9 mannosyltransferase domain containing protein [Aphelenchoides besseyi]|nr:Alg9 mannosyltransferase domain containing protein [Aphelenchoides besseyi]
MGNSKKNISVIRRLDNRTAARPPAFGSKQTSEDEVNDQHRLRLKREKVAAEARAKSDAGSFLWSNLDGKLIILDCDEVYNYWEPLHLLLFGRGFQTWEYSPEYGIRSWAYVYVHSLIGWLLLPLTWSSKVTLFYLIRCSISILSLTADYFLYQSLCKRLGNSIGSFFIVIHMFSVGVFNASCAFLPSSFAMTMNAFAMAAYLREQWLLAIMCTAIGALLGWPFTAVLGLPIVLEMCTVRFRQLFIKFIAYSLLCGFLTLSLMCWVDYYYYGKLVITPLNIVLYNVFSGHGPNLYGVEPISYYIKNLTLNWNISLLPALVSAPLAVYVYVRDNVVELKDGTLKAVRPVVSLEYWYRFIPVAFIFLSALLWLVIFFLQPHKEERFLFPIFPLIAILAAVGLQSLYHVLPWPRALTSAFIAIFVAISLSRGYALHRNYSASMETYTAFHKHFLFHNGTMDFSKMNNPIRLCVGKEWHRFPSSFFVPEKVAGRGNEIRAVEMQFLKSEFRGILPKHFEMGSIPEIMRRIPTEMNDENREESSRYVPLKSCDFVIDLDTGKYTEDEPDITNSEQFEVIYEKEFLLAENSHPIFRAFYIPFTDRQLTYGYYRLCLVI